MFANIQYEKIKFFKINIPTGILGWYFIFLEGGETYFNFILFWLIFSNVFKNDSLEKSYDT